jgi:hypothetical protein
MFDKKRNSSKGQPRQRDTNGSQFEERVEGEFEDKALDLINHEDWEKLEAAAVDQLDSLSGKSPRGFFYLGVALYKMNYYD